MTHLLDKAVEDAKNAKNEKEKLKNEMDLMKKEIALLQARNDTLDSLVHFPVFCGISIRS